MHSLLTLLFHQSDGICIHYQWRVLQFRFGRNREAILTSLRDSVVCEVFRGLDTPGQKAMRIGAAKDKNPPNVYVLNAATLFSNEPALAEYLSLWHSKELNDLCQTKDNGLLLSAYEQARTDGFGAKGAAKGAAKLTT